ncbi:MAG: AcrB/AcrD/AcrF family protein [Bdellovibrio sp.]|nr:MAG: AcrB/AcrD/AcrF family protein [Bdellovibrio sp.]
MTLPEISIRRPVFAWMLMAALITFGWIGFRRMGLSQLPDVDMPVVGVNLSLQGAAPEVMETQVLDPIEDAIMQIDGIRELRSSASQSSASLSIEFEVNRNIDEAVQEVQNRIAQVQNLMPTGLLPPTVRKTNPEDQPIMWLAVSADPGVRSIDLMSYARNTLLNQFATVEGVGDVVLGGYVDPALRVWVDLKRLKAYQLTASDVLTAITTEQVEIPAGRIENSQREYNVRVRGEAATPEDFGKIRIKKRSSGINFRPTELREVADIEEGTADVRRISRYNGQPALGLGILKQHGSNAVEVANAVRARLKAIEGGVPPQYHLTIRNDTTRFIKQSVNQLIFTLVLSALLTSLVCFLFLGSWTSTMNVLLAIPTSVIGSFLVLYFAGFTLNTFTLLGLSLAIGIVVDDAIMMLENIVRHRELGEKKRAAAFLGSEEIKFAAIAATVAVCAIFLPVIFMSGVMGRFFFQFGVTVTTAVLLSLLEALTLTPMRCSQYLQFGTDLTFSLFLDRLFHSCANAYQRALAVLVRYPWLTLASAVLLFAASLFLGKLIPSEMMPAQDQAFFMIRLKGQVGSSLDSTNEAMKRAEAYLKTQKEIDGFFSAVGGFGGDAVNQGNIMVSLLDANKRSATQQQIIDRLRKELRPIAKPLKVVVQDMSMRGFSPSRGFPIEFNVQGPDWEKLTELAHQMMSEAEASGIMTELNTDVEDGMPEYKIVPNRGKMAVHGVSLQTVTQALNALVGGALLNGQIEYPMGGHRYEIEVRLRSEQRNRSEQLKGIEVQNNQGQLVSLAELVDIQSKPSLMLISRVNRSRSITVYGNLAPGHRQDEALSKISEIEKKVLPPGYFLKLTGSAQSFKESMRSLVMALLLGILVSYMVLASQFNSFIHPIVVLLALPFSFSGALLALYLTHQSINIYSMIGFILLMGIVKKNSILLVDFTNQLRQRDKLDVRKALIAACPVRLRPILMTSIATVAGALPEALALGPGSETIIPMATAIVGGVIASTILTLFVVPCAYVLFSYLEGRPAGFEAELAHSSAS